MRVTATLVADIAAMPRPKILGETHGLMKLIVDARTDLLLGAALVLRGLAGLINLVTPAMRTGVSAAELRDGIGTHPSSTEALNEVLAALTLTLTSHAVPSRRASEERLTPAHVPSSSPDERSVGIPVKQSWLSSSGSAHRRNRNDTQCVL